MWKVGDRARRKDNGWLGEIRELSGGYLYLLPDGGNIGQWLAPDALEPEAATPLPAVVTPWSCKARTGNVGPEVQDCDWPVCGCDPHAQKVIDALDDCEYLLKPLRPEQAMTRRKERARLKEIAERCEGLSSEVRADVQHLLDRISALESVRPTEPSEVAPGEVRKMDDATRRRLFPHWFRADGCSSLTEQIEDLESALTAALAPVAPGGDDAAVARGRQQLEWMLDLIGDGEATDHDIAKRLVDNELDIRAALRAISPAGGR